MADSAELKIVLQDEAGPDLSPRQVLAAAYGAPGTPGSLSPATPPPGARQVLANAPPPPGRIHGPPKLPGEDPELTRTALPVEASSLKTAAGGAGTALGILEMSARATAAAFNTIRELAEVWGKSSRAAIANENIESFTVKLDDAGKTLGKIPIVGQALEAEFKAVTAVARELRDTVQAFIARGRELAQYSPALAVSGARADVRSLMSDIKEANELGPSLARLTDAESRLSADFREWMLDGKKRDAERLTALTSEVHELFDWMRGRAELDAEVASNFRGALIGVLSGVDGLPTLTLALANLPGALERAGKEAEARRMLQEDTASAWLNDQVRRMTSNATNVPMYPSTPDPVLGRLRGPRAVVP